MLVPYALSSSDQTTVKTESKKTSTTIVTGAAIRRLQGSFAASPRLTKINVVFLNDKIIESKR